ncbi:MAG: YchJ family metal-binding protein, partial [Vampirovibrionales bacterium]|nr:YchJ family metal-binding protein [Vampirovibrionales bacterium]
MLLRSEVLFVGCPCHSGLEYSGCCQPYHLGKAAPTALALMRSRYAAYALGAVDYLIDTTHRDNEQFNPHRAAWRRQLLAYCEATAFEGLEIVRDTPGAQESFVCFEARLRDGERGEVFVLRENSRFVKPGKRWL